MDGLFSIIDDMRDTYFLTDNNIEKIKNDIKEMCEKQSHLTIVSAYTDKITIKPEFCAIFEIHYKDNDDTDFYQQILAEKYEGLLFTTESRLDTVPIAVSNIIYTS